MHFWINKGSQGCGFNGRYVPPSISSGSRRNQCIGIHPKPMVTPVHRFQSIESVTSGVHRHSRPSAFHTRFPVPPPPHQQHHHHHPHSTIFECNQGRARRVSIDFNPNADNTLTHINPSAISTAKLKCVVWVVIGLIPFFIVSAKYYFNGVNMGLEAFTFCAIFIFILIIGGFVSLFEAFTSKRRHQESPPVSSEQNETFEDSSQVPTNATPIHAELPPPPYHLAVMLPTHNERLTVIQDSPPPTYEKAVT